MLSREVVEDVIRRFNSFRRYFVGSPFQIRDYNNYRVRIGYNPCGLLEHQMLCSLGTRGIWSPHQMTTFWGITYVIGDNDVPHQTQGG